MADLKNSRNTQLNGSITTIRTVSNQKSVTVTSPTAVVNYDSTGTLIPNQTLQITAIKFNTVAPVKWSTSNSGVKLYDANNAEITTDSGTSDTSVVYIRPAEFNTAGLSSLRVSASITDIDEISGYVTFIKLQASPGSSTFTASLYLQSANYPAGTPPAAPTGGTFNFTNSVLTPPAVPSGTTAANWWTATQPATSTTPTWACEYNFTGTSSQTVTAATWQNVRIDTVTGTAGTRTAILDLYKWSATAPNVNTASAWPTGTSVYTWATAQFAAKTDAFVYNLWNTTPGTPVAGQTLYIARQVYVDTGNSSTSDVIWTTRTAIPISSAGTNGSRTGVLEVYKWSTSQPSNSSPNTTFPEGTSTYTWNSGEFGLPAKPNGWSLLPGAAVAGSTLWATRILIVNTTTSNTTVGTWPTTNTSYAVGAAGIGGTSVNRVELYWQNATAPALPTKTRYTFSSDIVSILSDGSLGNWSRTKPNSTTIPTWMTACSFSVVAPADSQDNSNWTTPVIVAQNGTNGTPGVNGTKALPVSAFLWSTIVPTSYSQDAILDWTNNSIDKYPTGWSSSAGAAPGPTGYVLYQITVTVTADASTTSTAFNWSAASRNSIGYREDGTVGAQGDSARIAYLVTTSGTVPGKVTAATGDVVPTSAAGTWSFSATSNLNAGEYMYQVDGIYSKSSNITTWGNPYLSNLKVGTLSAITANVGNLTVAEQGNIRTYGKDFGEAGGFFIGFNGTTNQFSIGDKLTYSGTTFKVGGVTISATTGAVEGIGTGNGTIVNNDSARPGGVNLVGNSGFLRHNNVLPTNWFLYNNSSIAATTSVQSGGMFGQNYVRIIAGAATPTTLGIAVVSGIADSVKSWEPLQTYCISFWAKASAGALGKSMYGFYSNMGFTNGAELENPALTSSWQRYVFRGVPLSNANTSKGELYISVVQQGSTTPLPSGSVIDICCPKVELGTQPSSWTPSPQDIMNINLEPSISAAQLAADAAAVVANTATSNADAAKASAATAVQAIADISSDSLLTPDEKPQIIQDYEVIIAEKAGINAQAANYSVTTQNTAYNKTISDLTDYLATLNSPSAWNNLYGNTTIVGATFRTKFKDVYTTRQALLDVISAAAKTLSDAAQTTATNAGTAAATAQTTATNAATAAATAQTTATNAATAAATAQTTATNAASAAATANASIADISSDSLLTPDEKPQIIQDYDVIIAEKTGINSQATNYSVTTENTAYNTAVTALTTYLATLTTPVLWSTLSGNTTIVGATFRTKFKDVYTARQALLDVISAAAKTLSDAAQTTANAQSTIKLNVGGTGLSVLGTSCTKSSGTDAWNAQCYSQNAYVGGASCSFSPATVTGQVVAGLSLVPTTSASYEPVTYAIYLDGSSNEISIREYGSYVTGFTALSGALSTTDVFSIVYDGQFVRYFKNGTVFRVSAAPPNLKLYFDSSVYTVGGGLTNIQLAGYANTNTSRGTSLIDPSWWKVGVDPNSYWDAAGDTGVVNAFVAATLPDSSTGTVWQAISGTSNRDNSGGGWVTGANLTNKFPVNTAKTYMFAVYTKSVSGAGVGNNSQGVATAGQEYFGIDNYNTTAICNLNTTTANINPYFASTVKVDGEWHLLVGYVYPAGSTGYTNAGAGAYRCSNGVKIVDGSNWTWAAGTTQTGTRAFQYYQPAGSIQQFVWPQVYLCDGSEPSIDDLLSMSSISARNPLTTSNKSTYGYSGDLDATKGAPSGTLVGSTLAQNVESTTGAQSKADAAQSNAVSTAATDATTKANAAQAAAIAAAALDATTKAAAKLNKSAADTLSGPITVSTLGGIVAGSLTWDSTGTRTGGQGVAITPKGIVGHNGTKATFVIDSTSGDATFSGALSAATGSFAGSLSAATGTYAGSLSAATGSFAGSLSAATGTFSGSLNADAVNAVSTINIGLDQVTIPRISEGASGIFIGVASSDPSIVLLTSTTIDSFITTATYAPNLILWCCSCDLSLTITFILTFTPTGGSSTEVKRWNSTSTMFIKHTPNSAGVYTVMARSSSSTYVYNRALIILGVKR